MVEIIGDGKKKGEAVFLIVDAGRQVILEDRMRDGESFGVYAQRMNAEAATAGYIVTSPSEEMITTTFLGPGMSLTIVSEEMFQRQQQRARFMQQQS